MQRLPDSHYIPINKPEYFNFAVDVVDFWAAQPGNLQAMHWVSQDESCTRTMNFEYFARQSHRIAVLLERLGVKEDETMIMVLPRVPAWWEIALAGLRSGIVLSPATTLSTEKDIQYRCNKSKASVFVGDTVSVAKFLAVRENCPTVRTIVQVGDVAPKGVTSLYSALEHVEAKAQFKSAKRHWSRPALIYFTSGTSGPPKMVRHNQVSFPLALGSTGKHWYQLAPGKVLWNTAEQGWGKAAYSLFGAWNCGASLFVFDDRGAFSPQRLIDILHRYPITTLCAAPLAFRQLVLQEGREYLKRHPPMALTHCTAAGEALNAEVTRQWKNNTGLEIYEGYGQTETMLICGNFHGNQIRPGSMGKPAPGVPLHVITATGEIAADGEEGEMAVLLADESGNSSFFGLLDGYVREDNTCDRREKTFTINGKTKTWYVTGDRASRDADGYFWFVGRADDVINSSGYRIGECPFEVESTLKLHPAVAESAVVSSPDPVRGEVVKAFVVLTSEYKDAVLEALRKELQDFCKKNAAPYKYPRKIDFVHTDFFPKTTSGKIQRAELRKLEWKNVTNAKL
ncbi:acetyl-CoA synthetase-like protein [Plenodomus tracheiphilus IPT5]|uniref:medium-chain acyl-CoA ligase n=1 Tax=Plenodomus tracheiphilus IPT5 TaxID=1408161 RepID=A0A6A7APM1_9PLEO|nr:acetyl-CoA synthetase-like protein [Plenodomus tracheiphilus IPT5]